MRPGEKSISKAIDLCKAYKNLPPLRSALNLELFRELAKLVTFQTRVASFGARSAVMVFCELAPGVGKELG